MRAVGGIPLVRPGDDLVRLLGDALAGPGLLADGDILVVAQKIVSKAEGRL
ncbi:MAG TPA: coenzyme F420-0:L-glutamate ligase, partial [Acetobacteraceae bacterium]|nr:coenzyme F420-0:L-glutamate ligase [Acetobacteraceae bacterium]